MENAEEKKQAYLLSFDKITKLSIKELPFKIRLKTIFGGTIEIVTKAHIVIQQDDKPIVTQDGIEIYIKK